MKLFGWFGGDFRVFGFLLILSNICGVTKSDQDEDIEDGVTDLVLNFEPLKRALYLTVYKGPSYNGTIKVYCETDADDHEGKEQVVTDFLYLAETYVALSLEIKPYVSLYTCRSSSQLSNTALAYREDSNEFSWKLTYESEEDTCEEDEFATKILNELRTDLSEHALYIRMLEFHLTHESCTAELLIHISRSKTSDIFEDFTSFSETLSTFTKYQTISFRPSLHCLPEVTHGVEALHWPLTPSGDTITPSELCFAPSGVPLTRTCYYDFRSGPTWSDPGPADCDGHVHVSPKTDRLHQIALADPEEVDDSEMVSLTEDTFDLNPVDVYFLGSILKGFTKRVDVGVSIESAAGVVGNVMDARRQMLKEAQERFKATDEVLLDFESLQMEFGLSFNGDVFVVEKRNLLLVVFNPFLNGFKGIILFENDYGLLSRDGLESGFEGNVELAVVLPERLLETVPELQQKNFNVIISILSNDKMFNPLNASESEKVDGKVVSVTVPGFGIYLQVPVTIYFKSSERENASCAYWDYGTEINKKNGSWSELGGNLQITENNITSCSYTHLTHFALLIYTNRLIADDDGDDSIINDPDDYHQYILTILTIIESILSILGLLMIFLTAILFKKFRETASTKILLQLALVVALEILMVQVAGIVNLKIVSCRIIGIVTHYVVLAKFTWLLVFALLQYYRYVRVFGPHIPHLVLKASLFAWSLPALPVILVATISISSYSGGVQNFCYPKNMAAIYSVVLPISLITLANLIAFCVIMCSVVRRDLSMAKDRKKIHVYLAALLFFMLGLPWVFGIIGEVIEVGLARLVFAYLFCITATLQGFVLFVFYVAMNRSVRGMWGGLMVTPSPDVST